MTVLDRMTSRYRGTFWRRNFALLEQLWEPTLDLLGTTATVLPLIGLGDDGLPNAATFVTRRGNASGLEATFTWQATDGGPSNWTDGNDLTSPDRWQGIVPFLDFDGLNDEADSPDDPYWSRVSGAFSIGMWVNLTDATNITFLSKFDSPGDTREWFLDTNASDLLRITLVDENVSANPEILTLADAALVQDVWVFIVVTADGTADASGLNLYQDGALVASTDSDNAAFLALEDLGGTVKLAHLNASPGNLLDGKMAGGPLGPFFTQVVLTAAEIKRLYNLGRAALGV